MVLGMRRRRLKASPRSAARPALSAAAERRRLARLMGMDAPALRLDQDRPCRPRRARLGRRRQELPGQGVGDQGAGVVHAIERDEGAEARAALPRRAAPDRAWRTSRSTRPAFPASRPWPKNSGSAGSGGPRRRAGSGPLRRSDWAAGRPAPGESLSSAVALHLVRRAVNFFGPHEIAEIDHRIADHPVEPGEFFRAGARRVTAQEAPQDGGVLAVGDRRQIEQHGEGNRGSFGLALMRDEFRRRRFAGMNMPGRVAEPQFPVLARIGVEKGEIFVDRRAESRRNRAFSPRAASST